MEEIIRLFIRSFEDPSFTSSERQAVRQLIEAYQPTRSQRDLLRSKIFDIVRRRFPHHPEATAFDWLETANKTLLEKGEASTVAADVFFSPGERCLGAILGLLHSATVSLHVCVFTVSDDRITRATLGAKHRNVEVRLLTDNEKLYDDGSDIRQLVRAGVAVRVDNTSNHMHHKFAVADRRTLLTGSYNWTRSAALYNHENVLVTAEPRVVEAYVKQFAVLWEEMTPFT